MRIQPIVLFCCVAGLAVSAEQPIDAPVIKVNTRLVEVDAIVRNKTGSIADLAKEDFTITDNGKPQKISIFSVKTSVRSAKKAVAPLPQGVVSNRINSLGEEPEAATVVLWDSLNTDVTDQGFVRGEVLKYLKTMKAGDPVALYLMSKTLKVVQDFTVDPGHLLRAVLKTGAVPSTALQALDLTDLAATIGGQFQTDPYHPGHLADNQAMATVAAAEMEDYDLKDRAYLTEASLDAIAAHLAGLPGRKKLIWITGSLPAIKRDNRTRPSLTMTSGSTTSSDSATSSSTTPLVTSSGSSTGSDSTTIEVQDFGPQIKRAIQRLNNANVAVYPIDPRGLTSGFSMAHILNGATGIMPRAPSKNDILPSDLSDLPGSTVTAVPDAGLTASGIDTMNLIANGTGGVASYGGNDIAAALRGVFDDDEVTYTLGFYANDAKMDGAYHDISVKVRRSGVDVRARRGYLGLDSKLITEGHWREALDESMRNPLEATALGVRASAVPIAGAPGAYDLSVTMDTSDIHFDRVKDRWIAQVSYATRFSPSDTTKGTIETIQIALTEAKLKNALKNGFTFRRTLAAGDLKGELRVMVEDRTTGALGSVSVPIGQTAN